MNVQVVVVPDFPVPDFSCSGFLTDFSGNFRRSVIPCRSLRKYR